MILQLTLKKDDEEVFGKGISTDRDGYFIFKSLPPADHYLIVPNPFLPGLKPKEKSGSLLTANVIKDVDFTIDRKVSFAPPEGAEDKVAFGTILGRIIADDTDEGVEWALVNAELKKEDGRQTFVTFSDDKGSYVMKGLPPGTYEIYFDTLKYSEFISTEAKRIYNTNPPFPIHTVNLSEGENISLPDFKLIRGGGISGVVVDKVGVPISNIKLNVGALYLWESSDVTEDDGSFLIMGLPEGDNYKIRIHPKGYGPIIKEGFGIKAGEVTKGVKIVADWDMKTGVSGVIKSSLDSSPLKGALVLLVRDPDYIISEIKSDNLGRYQIVGIEPGEYKVSVLSPWDRKDKKYIRIKKDEVACADFSFPEKQRDLPRDPEPDFSLLTDPDNCAGYREHIRTSLQTASNNWYKLPGVIRSLFDPNNYDVIFFKCSNFNSCGAPTSPLLRKVYLSLDWSWKVGTCGCLAGTIFHELLHFTDQGRNNDPQIPNTQDERDAYNCTKKCID